MLKEISEPYQIISSFTASGTTTTISSASSVKYKDSVAYQVNWSGAPQGTVSILGSVDYNPGLPQSAGGARSGNWTTITSQAVGSGVSQPILFNLNQLAFPWTQVQYTSSTATGVMSVWFAAKSLG